MKKKRTRIELTAEQIALLQKVIGTGAAALAKDGTTTQLRKIVALTEAIAAAAERLT